MTIHAIIQDWKAFQSVLRNAPQDFKGLDQEILKERLDGVRTAQNERFNDMLKAYVVEVSDIEHTPTKELQRIVHTVLSMAPPSDPVEKDEDIAVYESTISKCLAAYTEAADLYTGYQMVFGDLSNEEVKKTLNAAKAAVDHMKRDMLVQFIYAAEAHIWNADMKQIQGILLES